VALLEQEELDQVTFRGPFQPQPFCDAVWTETHSSGEVRIDFLLVGRQSDLVKWGKAAFGREIQSPVYVVV